jgi:hypothetical protein
MLRRLARQIAMTSREMLTCDRTELGRRQHSTANRKRSPAVRWSACLTCVSMYVFPRHAGRVVSSNTLNCETLRFAGAVALTAR